MNEEEVAEVLTVLAKEEEEEELRLHIKTKPTVSLLLFVSRRRSREIVVVAGKNA